MPALNRTKLSAMFDAVNTTLGPGNLQSITFTGVNPAGNQTTITIPVAEPLGLAVGGDLTREQANELIASLVGISRT